MSNAEKRLEMGFEIVRFEGRYVNGKLQVYILPESDGGGQYEVSGINQKYHPAKAEQLKKLIENGQYAEAEHEAAAYIEEYTRGVLRYFPSPEAADANPSLEFILRDTAFNRGFKGCATVLQLALGMQDIDGVIGPATKAEFEKQLHELDAEQIALALTSAREIYERNTYGWKKNARDESSRFWAGLSNRWKKSHQIAISRFA